MEAKILNGVLHSDTHARLQAGELLLDYLRDESNDIAQFEELDRLINGLCVWMGSSNFKISLQAMDLLVMIIMELKDKFKSYISAVLPAIREKLGDSKDQVREKTQVLIQQIMQESLPTNPQKLLDHILDAGILTHKNWRAKEQGLSCIYRSLNYFGTGHITVSKYVGSICELLGDANSTVRSAALECLVEIYRHVGVKVRIDLSKRNIPPNKLQMVLQKFDEVDGEKNGRVGDDHSQDGESLSSCSSSASLSARNHGSAHAVPPTSSLVTKRKKSGISTGSSGGSGAVSEEDFEKAFDDVPQLNIFTNHDLETTLVSIHRTLTNKNTEWDTRIDTIKEFKALIQLESLDHQIFLSHLRTLEIPFSDLLKDLRSQVVKEACITVSCLAYTFKTEVAQFCEQMLPNLINLMPNSAKVMATSACVCCKMIIKNCPSHRLLPLIAQCIHTSKSAVIRKMCGELLDFITHTWDTTILDRTGSVLEDAIVKGVKDADATTRKFMRRAFWGYHDHYPSAANRLLESFDLSVQKHLKDEKTVMSGGKTPPPSTNAAPTSSIKKFLKKANNNAFNQIPGGIEIHVDPISSLPPRPPSSNAIIPSIKVRPVVRPGGPRRVTEPALSSKLSKSSENLSGDIAINTPSSGGSNIVPRPSSRSGTAHNQVARPSTPTKSKSQTMRHSREESPPVKKSHSMPRKTMYHTTSDTALIGDYDDDDAGSVTSERSSFSISSEVSLSPYAYAKYPNPVTDLDELIKLCTSKSWNDRKDGIAQLHLLLESDRSLSHAEISKVKDVFKHMLAERNPKVYGMFLDTLSKFIEERREYLEDWVFLLLLRLLHKHGSDLLKSLHLKLQVVLEHVRRSFEPDHQFSALCRIITDQSQPMNNKVKLAWLEYVYELIPLMDPAHLKETPEMRHTFSKILSLTVDKAPEIRKACARVICALFELNSASYSMLLRGVPRDLQEVSQKIIEGFLQEESDDDDDDDIPPSPIRVPLSPKSPKSPKSPRSPRSSTELNKTPRADVSVTPKSNKLFSSSSPNITSSSYEGTPTPKVTPTSRLSTSSASKGSPSGRMTPSRIPRPASRQGGSYRAQSVDPERMLQSSSRDRYQRPTSSQSEYMMSSTMPGNRFSNGPGRRPSYEQRPPSSQGFMLDHFISTLPVLDYGSPGPEASQPGDQVAQLLKQLENANNPKSQGAALQSLHSLAKVYDNNNWKDHIHQAFTILLALSKEQESLVRNMSLRVIRELIKSRPPGVTKFTEDLTTVVLESFKDKDCNVSQAAEDLFTPLSNALPPQRMMDILGPLISSESDTDLLGALKLLSKVITHTDEAYMEGQLTNIVPGVIKGYCNEESSVRKASVFCLVELHSVVGEKLRPHLSTLSSSQTKLLDLYISRHHGSSKSVSKRS